MQPSCPREPACTDMSICPAHPLFSPSSPSNFSTQFIHLWQRATGLKNTLIPPLAETEQRTGTFSVHKKGFLVSTTLIRHWRTHPAIPNPSESQAATLRHRPTATRSAAQLYLPPPFTPKRLLHQNPLLSPPKSHGGGVSSRCLTRGLGHERSPAKHPQGMGFSWRCQPSIPRAREGRRQEKRGSAQHGPLFLSKCLFSCCFNRETFSVSYLKAPKPQTKPR